MLSPTVVIRILTTILINKISSNQSCWWFNQEFSVLLNKWGTQAGIKPGFYNSAFPQHRNSAILLDTQLRCSGLLRKIFRTWKSRITWKILSFPFYEFFFFNLIPLLILDKGEGFLVNLIFSVASPCSAFAKSLFHMSSVQFSFHICEITSWQGGKQNNPAKRKKRERDLHFLLKQKDRFHEIILSLKWVIKAKINQILEEIAG